MYIFLLKKNKYTRARTHLLQQDNQRKFLMLFFIYVSIYGLKLMDSDDILLSTWAQNKKKGVQSISIFSLVHSAVLLKELPF